MRYIGTFILPRRFVIEEPVTLFNSLANPVALLSAIFILAAVILIIRFRLPKIALGAAWFAAFIFPVCGIIAVNSFFYNHWLYIPSLGLLAVSAGILSFGVRKLSAARWGRAARYLIGCAGAVYLAMLCTLTIQQNRYWSNAITMGEKTLEAAPDSARVNYALGNAYNEAGRYQEAASFLKKAIEIDPKNPTPYILLGNSYYGLGEFNKAIAQYMKARELGPAPVKVEMCNNVANCHVALGDTDKAIEWFNKAVAEKPDLPYLYYNLGLIYMGKSENKRAAELFTKALKVDPAMKETYVNLALIYNNEGEPQKAIEQLKKAIEVDPEYQKAYNNLSALYAAINQHDLAAQYREKADRLNRK
jgi:tetratricopeptide (TPR) repeat protein